MISIKVPQIINITSPSTVGTIVQSEVDTAIAAILSTNPALASTSILVSGVGTALVVISIGAYLFSLTQEQCVDDEDPELPPTTDIPLIPNLGYNLGIEIFDTSCNEEDVFQFPNGDEDTIVVAATCGESLRRVRYIRFSNGPNGFNTVFPDIAFGKDPDEDTSFTRCYDLITSYDWVEITNNDGNQYLKSYSDHTSVVSTDNSSVCTRADVNGFTPYSTFNVNDTFSSTRLKLFIEDSNGNRTDIGDLRTAKRPPTFITDTSVPSNLNRRYRITMSVSVPKFQQVTNALRVRLNPVVTLVDEFCVTFNSDFEQFVSEQIARIALGAGDILLGPVDYSFEYLGPC